MKGSGRDGERGRRRGACFDMTGTLHVNEQSVAKTCMDTGLHRYLMQCSH